MSEDAKKDDAKKEAAPQKDEGAKGESKDKQPRWRGWVRDALVLIAVAGVSMAARSTLADNYHVPSGSMRPTVEIGDRLLVNKLAYGLRVPFTRVYVARFDDPQHGDVVVLRSPEDGIVLLKRIVALPGDEIAVEGGQLILNGEQVEIVEADLVQLKKLLHEEITPEIEQRSQPMYIEMLGEKPHGIRLTRGGGGNYGPKEVPEDQFLVMGDNRGESRDGRVFGLVDRKQLLGRGIAVYRRDGKFVWEKL